eukprot:TRINITY_DN28390_c0_g1_i1.p1 TRINITY_DN28390_c0_g1~~TRINITY_DN28390_c0_g1_i1.p1  ORF type:complete len:466 (+),score=99.86 TRINITY_DN28390_c0_g1_i1:31-1398(+)
MAEAAAAAPDANADPAKKMDQTGESSVSPSGRRPSIGSQRRPSIAQQRRLSRQEEQKTAMDAAAKAAAAAAAVEEAERAERKRQDEEAKKAVNDAKKKVKSALEKKFADLEKHSEKEIGIEVDLRGEPIGDAGAARIKKALEQKGGTIKRLILQRCGLTRNGIVDIGVLTESMPVLEFLCLSGNLAGPTCLKDPFADAMDRHKTLKVLDISGCEIGDTGLDPLMLVLERWDDSLKPRVPLEKLNLGFNGIGPVGMRRIATMLSTSRHLEELVLEGNPLGPEGGEELAKGLLGNKGRVRRLHLTNCLLKEKGAKALAKVFKVHPPTFTIEFKRRAGTSSGFVLDGENVMGVEGASWLDLYGQENPPNAVFAGDRVVKVNEKTEIEEMAHELNTQEDLQVTVTRPETGIEYMDIQCNQLGASGAKKVREILGKEREGGLLGCTLRCDSGRIICVDAV